MNLNVVMKTCPIDQQSPRKGINNAALYGGTTMQLELVKFQAATDQRLLLIIASQTAEKYLTQALEAYESAMAECARAEGCIAFGAEKLSTKNAEVDVAATTLNRINQDLDKNGEAEVKVAIHRVSIVIDALERAKATAEQAPITVWRFGETPEIRETRLKQKTHLEHLRDELHRLHKILEALKDMRMLPVSAIELKSMVTELLTDAGLPDTEKSAEEFFSDQINSLTDQFSAITSEIFSHGR